MLSLVAMLALVAPADSAALAAAIARLPAPVRRAAEAQYAARGWAPLWSTAAAPSAAARRLARELAAAADRGLDPARYGAPSLASRLARWDTTATARADFDAALTRAVLGYARALDRGELDPGRLHPALRLDRPPFDAHAVLGALLDAPDPLSVLRALEPPFHQYRRLLGILQRYRILAADSTLPALPPGPRVLRPDSTWRGLPALRRRLAAVGDLPRTAVGGAADTAYDPGTVAAVQRFQRRHGLEPDGIIGPATRIELARPMAERVRQVQLALERWRWLPRDHGRAPLIVNIPAFRLDALAALPEVERETLSMDVVVGTAVTHGTPILAAPLRRVVFQPWWNVPRSIALAEIRPKALADSTWLAREGYELRRNGQPIPATPGAVDSIGLDVWVHQRPGPGNALGRVKFLMPNREDIYLHDTPARDLFGRRRRDFSHGCIRVADPAALAAWVLRDLPEWTPERIAAALAGTETIDVTLPEPVPVYLVYHTAEVGEDGTARFHADVYGHDAMLVAAIRERRTEN